MNLFDVVILSIIEGFTEFLPVSSTAHLILSSYILGVARTDFLTTFEIAIQFGAILAVIALYLPKIKKQVNLLYMACIGFIPTGILGLIFYKYIKAAFGDPIIPVITLFLGGIAIIGIEYYFKTSSRISTQNTKNLSNLTYKDALLVGLMQSISMVPGVSRAASSIFGAMILRFDRKSAVEFSFLLAIPTMLAATTLDLAKSAPHFTSYELLLLIFGILFSFVVALFVIKWLLQYVQKNDFILFGFYRIVLSVLYYLLFLK